MSNITVIPSGGGGGTTFNKEVYVGPAGTTFTAASDGLVEVNCWGGGEMVEKVMDAVVVEVVDMSAMSMICLLEIR